MLSTRNSSVAHDGVMCNHPSSQSLLPRLESRITQFAIRARLSTSMILPAEIISQSIFLRAQGFTRILGSRQSLQVWECSEVLAFSVHEHWAFPET
jgi:hypothetical protein